MFVFLSRQSEVLVFADAELTGASTSTFLQQDHTSSGHLSEKTRSPLVYQDSFQLAETSHRYRVIRLWEEHPEPFSRIWDYYP
jgi:hypothetical protein